MTTSDTFRDLSLSLQGSVEVAHFDRRAFKVRRIFASLAADGETANLYLTPPEQEYWRGLFPDTFAPVSNKWGARGWTQVRLATIGSMELLPALRAAWSNGGGSEPPE
ncbi:MmcQ/YjbR family DNA-binding protein [Nitratireductor sp. ZSWI3]|uniref:MmcQ/YjbR family DNA-binding protein n=1 Tax=Nitratireductor sp. ZSWI3 TaxID=2966359 RepID=UPI00214F8A85|nr:MmcQ/YjbR family DNA-binding protein [Nitratireductor sp. ZSWI3]MCR4265938.1 MmcQ/YjbR family DNA-binding protein [Nitratireductor sp. ZSWI3]